MKNDPKIKFSQLLLLLFLSMLFPFMLISGERLSDIGIWSFAIWALLTLLQTPLLFYASKRKLSLGKGFSAVLVRAVILIYLVCVCIRFTVVFADFFNAMINTSAAAWFVALLMLICAYCAVLHGIRGLSAASVIFTAFTVFMLILLLIGAVPQINVQNISAVNLSDKNLLDFVLLLLSLNFVFPLLIIFNYDTALPQKRSVLIALPVTLALTEALIIALTILCLGRYAFTQPYPIMTLFRSPNLNILETVSGVWFFILTILCLCAVSACATAAAEISGSTRRGFSALVLLAAVFVGFLTVNLGIIDMESNLCTAVTAVLSVISAVLCLAMSQKKNPQKDNTEK